MLAEKKPSKTRIAKGRNLVKEHKATLAKKMKVEMIRYCMVWNYNEKQAVTYFAKRGVKLSIPYYYELKEEYLSDDATKGWYTEQALFAMETTHKQSIEQLNEIIKITLNEIEQLQSTDVYLDEKLNEEHNSIGLAKMIDTLTKLIAQRDDMLAATPIVQGIMNKHAKEQEKSMVVK
jgi:hypothetical protein